MNHALTATLTCDYRGGPLAVIDDMPGGIGFEASPARLRELAAALLCIADDAEAAAKMPAPRRGPPPSLRRAYPTA